jgi:hypothetical protein
MMMTMTSKSMLGGEPATGATLYVGRLLLVVLARVSAPNAKYLTRFLVLLVEFITVRAPLTFTEGPGAGGGKAPRKGGEARGQD